MDREVVREIKNRADIVALIAEYLPLKKRGKEYVGLCPFHAEESPSFSVSPEQGLFYCFGCQAGGDIFQFLMRRENLTFSEALQRLAAKVGVTLPSRELSPEEERRQRHREVLYRVMERAAALFREALLKPEGRSAGEYLGRRGINEEVAERFCLGYAPGPGGTSVTRRLLAEGFPVNALAAAGLIRRGDKGWRDWFYGRILFPITDPVGRIIAFGGRALEADKGPKYLNSPETEIFDKGKVWYGLSLAKDSIRREGCALVVEGYVDVVTAHQYGFTAAVASMGTSLTSDQVRLLVGQRAQEVVLAFDADAAGQKAARKGLELFGGSGVRVRVGAIPDGKDPDEFLRRHGREEFQAVLDRSSPLLDFLVAEVAVSSQGGRFAKARELFPFLVLADSLERDRYIQQLARLLQVPEDSVRAEMRTTGGQKRPGGTNLHSVEHISPGKRHNKRDNLTFKAERTLLILGLRSTEGREATFWERGGDNLAGLISDPLLAEIAKVAAEMAVAGEDLAPGEILSRISAPEVADLAAGIFREGVLPADTVKALEDCLDILKGEKLRAKQEEILQAIADGEKRGESVNHLLRELTEINAALEQGKEG